MGEQWVAELNSEPIIRGVSVLEFYSFFSFLHGADRNIHNLPVGRGSTGFREIMGHVE